MHIFPSKQLKRARNLVINGLLDVSILLVEHLVLSILIPLDVGPMMQALFNIIGYTTPDAKQ